MNNRYHNREEKYQRQLDKAYQKNASHQIKRAPRNLNLNSTTGVIIATLLLASVIIAAAQEVEAENTESQLSKTTSDADKSKISTAALAMETACKDGICDHQTEQADRPQFSLRRAVSVEKTLEEKVDREQLTQAKVKIVRLLQDLYDSSRLVKKHFDYSLATGCKFTIVASHNWRTFEYNSQMHAILIPMPPKNIQSLAHAYKELDEYEYQFKTAIIHELEHSRWAIINSDKSCNPYNSYLSKFLLKKVQPPFPADPSEPKELMQRISVVQDYILDHVAKILPATFIDFTKAYPKHPKLFTMQATSNKPTDESVGKELAHLQQILKDYQPRRVSVQLTENNAHAAINAIKNGMIMKLEDDCLGVSIDHVYVADGKYIAIGYLVSDPRDKVRALVMDTKYIKECMPRNYQEDFLKSPDPYAHKVAETEAHTYEMGLNAYNKIYTLAAKFTEQKQRESACQP